MIFDFRQRHITLRMLLIFDTLTRCFYFRDALRRYYFTPLDADAAANGHIFFATLYDYAAYFH